MIKLVTYTSLINCWRVEYESGRERMFHNFTANDFYRLPKTIQNFVKNHNYSAMSYGTIVYH